MTESLPITVLIGPTCDHGASRNRSRNPPRLPECHPTIEGLAEDSSLIYPPHWQEGGLVVFDAIGTYGRDSFRPDQKRYMRQLSTVY